jgi:magnesium transporter
VSVPAPTPILLGEEFVRLYPYEVAAILENEPPEATAHLLAAWGVARSTALLERLTPEAAAEVLARLDAETARVVLPALDPARTAILLARLDDDVRRARLALVAPSTAAEIQALLQFPPDSAGRLMDVAALTLRPDATAAGALARLRAVRRRRVHDVFVVDADGRLTGVVRVQDLATAEPETRLDALTQPPGGFVLPVASREEVVELFAERPLSSLPVLDVDGRLLGVVRHAEVVAAAEAEATADIQTMVGASAEERALSPALFSVKKRLPWLQLNLATAFLASAVVGLFENTIARFTALAVLLPVVAGQSGNTGAQALAVTMRGLALREIRTRHWPQVTSKELRVGFINGVAVALTTAAGVWLWSRSGGLALVIGVSMVISMVAAGLAGATIPIVLGAVGRDPAQSSSIFLTTVTDVVGFLSFLGIATLLAGLLG